MLWVYDLSQINFYGLGKIEVKVNFLANFPSCSSEIVEKIFLFSLNCFGTFVEISCPYMCRSVSKEPKECLYNALQSRK